MPDYKEQAIAGKTWIRSYRATCSNDHTRKSIWFDEERVVLGPDGERITATSIGMGCGMELTADNAETAFALLDADGNPTGQSASYADVYQIMMSLYYHVAGARDTAQEAPQ